MWKKQQYQIDLQGEKQGVEGTVNGSWGIDKRGNQYYVLTHVPTGFFVESARTIMFLKNLVDCEEFANYDGLFGHNDASLLQKRIKAYRDEHGWNR